VLKGAIIGFGEVARHGHWPGYVASQDAKIIAVVDPAEERRSLARRLLPEIATFSTIEELAASPAIDFVDICSPPAFHASAMMVALARKWNVICEKPLVLDLLELDHLRRAAKRAERAVFPVQNWKYAPIVRHATQLLRQGGIGKLRRLEMETLRVHDCAVADPDRPGWRRNPAVAGGGVLVDHGWHAIYLACHWFGEKPHKVHASLHHPKNSAIEDEATLMLLFPSGQAEVFLTWRADRRRNRIRLEGERGEIEIDDDTLRATGKSIRFEQGLSVGSHHADWFAAMLPDVIASFNRPAIAQASFDQAAVCLSVIQRAYRVVQPKSPRSAASLKTAASR
jgi:predicted dehydrogenase